MSEVIYVDDQLGGKFNRTNTTLKWWSWIYPATLLTLGSICLGAGRWLRWAAVAVLLLVASYGIDLAAYWGYSQKASLGRLAGNHWLRQDQVDKQLLEFLRLHREAWFWKAWTQEAPIRPVRPSPCSRDSFPPTAGRNTKRNGAATPGIFMPMPIGTGRFTEVNCPMPCPGLC